MPREINRIINFLASNKRAQFHIQITSSPSPSVWHYLWPCSISITSQPWQRALNKFIFVDCGWNLWQNISGVELITGLDFCTVQLRTWWNANSLSSQAVPYLSLSAGSLFLPWVKSTHCLWQGESKFYKVVSSPLICKAKYCADLIPVGGQPFETLVASSGTPCWCAYLLRAVEKLPQVWGWQDATEQGK